MPKSLRIFLVPAIALAASASAFAQLSLPGKTLSRAGLEPAKNAKNIAKRTVSPDCPYLGMSLRDLLLHARNAWPALYRTAVKLRRTGFDAEATRQWLEQAICVQEGF